MSEEILKTYRFSICKKNNPNNFGIESNEYIYSRLVKNHLFLRGFRTYNLSSNVIISDDNIKFCISIIKGLENPYFNIDIKCLDKWKNYDRGIDPIIIYLIFDFFKLHSDTWTIIEFLSPNELVLVERFKRRITPSAIIKRLKNVKVSKDSRKFDLTRIQGGGTQTIITLAYKSDYLDSIEFWLNYTSWDFTEGEEFDGAPSGSRDCIPLDIESLSGKINEIYNVVDKEIAGKVLEAYLMDKQWDDKKYLFIYQNIYAIHHWWTGN